MATQVIDASRVQVLNDDEINSDGSYVLYWMQQSQRAEFNPALEHAVRAANDHDARLLVCFGVMDDYPEANARHYHFMLEGLSETQQALKRRGIPLNVKHGAPDEVALSYAADAIMIVTDRGYLRHQKNWRKYVAEEATCRVEQVEGDVIVPVEVASDKAEHAARTLRPKIHEHAEDYLVELKTTSLDTDSMSLSEEGLDLSDVDAVIGGLDLDRSVPPVPHVYQGGTRAAKSHLDDFLESYIDGYDDHRNQPQTDYVSHLSKYLHFGQISPVDVVLRVRAAGGPEDDVDSLLEEIMVRRELAMNFVHYTSDYDSYSCLPGWAKETLDEHKDDEREHVYTQRELEQAQTHDAYWNAAMNQMRYTGYMHNYMRMYWGKKIIQWTNTPRHAHKVALELNNKYFLDGRDCNSFSNVAWLFGQHDRGWQEREVFGKVRYMSSGGLERKAKPEEYVKKVERLVQEAQDAGVHFDDE